jgi:hypothetical protein
MLRLAVQSVQDGWNVNTVENQQVLETLANAPFTRGRSPIDLLDAEAVC